MNSLNLENREESRNPVQIVESSGGGKASKKLKENNERKKVKAFL